MARPSARPLSSTVWPWPGIAACPAAQSSTLGRALRCRIPYRKSTGAPFGLLSREKLREPRMRPERSRSRFRPGWRRSGRAWRLRLRLRPADRLFSGWEVGLGCPETAGGSTLCGEGGCASAESTCLQSAVRHYCVQGGVGPGRAQPERHVTSHLLVTNVTYALTFRDKRGKCVLWCTWGPLVCAENTTQKFICVSKCDLNNT